MVNMSYDEANDVLYVQFSDKRISFGNEITSRLIISRDMDTNVVTGLTIMDWKRGGIAQ